MNISRFLAKVMGIYFIILSAVFFINPNNFITLIQEFTRNKAIFFGMGFITLIMGILLIVSHNIWQFSWKVIITVISWITFIKGLLLLVYPKSLDILTQYFVQNKDFAYVSIGIDLILGFILLYFGFAKEKDQNTLNHMFL